MALDLPYRQLHLDFHNSPKITGVGALFDEKAFIADLQRARVQSVTCFSRCHHGHIYHETRFSDLRHPHLQTDLLGRQIAACHSEGIRVPVYVSVGWDEIQAKRHPDWLERDEQGRTSGPGVLSPGFQHKFCLHGPYVDFLEAQISEVLENYPCDGMFFDIVFQGPCLCRRCLLSMAQLGLDPTDPLQRSHHADGVLDGFKRRISALVRGLSPEASIFFNAGHVGPETRRTVDCITHLELESLSGGHWGHLHFPITDRYARGMGLPRAGMTAVFFGSWGDLGALKSPVALEQECMQMLAHGSRCSVGDQLQPEGCFSKDSVDLLETVFSRVERCEPWCRGAEPVTEIGVFYPESFGAQTSLLDRTAAGVVSVLQEGHQQFEFIDGGADFSSYRVLVVPDMIRVGDDLADCIGTYLKGGGSLLLTHLAGLAPGEDRFTLPEVGATCLGPSPFEPDFLVPDPELSAALPGGPKAMKWRAMRVRPLPGTRVLAGVQLPAFNRTWRHFHGHQHAPPTRPADYPAAIQRGRVIYLAHPLFCMYRQHGWPWCRDLVLAALARLLPQPLVVTRAPKAVVATVTRQKAEGRTVLHLLHYLPRQMTEHGPVVDERMPVLDVELGLRCEEAPGRVVLVPQEQELAFAWDPPYARFTVPGLDGHQMVSVE